MTELQRQYAELSATLTPEHYKVQRVQAQITELQFNMLQERSTIQRRIGNEYSAALRREKLLSQADAEQEKVVADLRVESTSPSGCRSDRLTGLIRHDFLLLGVGLGQ